MWLDIRVNFLLLLFIVSPTLERRYKRQDVNFGNDKNDCRTPRNVPGQCINIKTCPVLLDMLQQRKEPGWREYLLKSQCGTKENNIIKVCCPGPSTETPVNTQSNDLPDTNVCGRSDAAANRVVNGRPAVLGAWPWMAALGYSSPTKPLDWLCGGSLISSRHVLTAAHCLVNIGRRTLTVVRLGDLNLNDSIPDRATPMDIPVEKTIVHENYDAAAHTVDIALVKLKNPVEFTKLIRPICIPSQSIFPQDITGYSPFVIGWGAIGYRGPSTTALQEAQIDISDQNFCSNAYRNIKGATIDSRVICALSPQGRDACQGDSGGPLILPKQSNFYLIGIVSYGYKCAEPGFPGVYTKVSLYVDWIKKTMRS
ncbi:venom protease-like isoform X2 [Macrosteles quadrilineatus]|uniref:venom protease-like isoform X2 n=1 Tax=Macrosteles quadrilineatus TaxID=74068 RepID=UPI0023E113A8|nr:venom protease-like isoform X2 [Macrosteles quadrilineatus]